MTRWSLPAALGAAVALALPLTACAGSPAAPAPAVTEAAEVLPSSVASAIAGDEDLDGEADAGAALTADAFCAFLVDEGPQVQDLAPPEYAAATFGGALFTFYSEQGLMTDIDGADMDVLAADGCPDVAAALLPVLGATSFAELLSS